MGVDYDYYFNIRKNPPTDKMNKNEVLSEIHSSMNDILATNHFNQYDVLVGTDMYREKALVNFTREIECVLLYKRMKEAVYNSSARELLNKNGLVKTGDYITHRDKHIMSDIRHYIVRNMTDRKYGYDSHFILICQQVFGWMHEDQVIHKFPVHFIDNKTMMGEKNSTAINLGSDIQQCYIQENEHTCKIDNGWRFISKGECFKVVGKDPQTMNGLITLRLEKTPFKDDDNRDLEIADYYKYYNPDPPTDPDPEPEPSGYEIEIDGSSTLYLGYTSSYTATVKVDGNILNGIDLDWNLRNEDGSSTNYATINSIDGNKVVLKAGTSTKYIDKVVILKAYLRTDENIYTEKEITIDSLM